ncbi:MAG: DUF4139 domain-containing protein [Tannerella sp.]|jgi:hypothetical protein|nr:DUF4139 domain-containing protein [Tannerella sp.]
MNTKAFFLITLFLAGAATCGAAETQSGVRSTLSEVTLFFHGAELTHSARAPLTKGENEVLISGLSPVIDRNSLKITATGGAVISAYEFSVDYLSQRRISPVAQRLTDSIELCRTTLQQVEVDRSINSQLIDLLQKGTAKNVSGSENGMTFAELVQTMDYFRTKSVELESASVENRKKRATLEAEIKRLEAQLNDESARNSRTAGVLKILLNAPVALNSDFTVSYFTPAAGWTPCYDIIVESTARPIKIISKAKLRQTTGVEWERVKLTLSTATPGNGRTAPLFNAWFLDYQYARIDNDAILSQNAYSYRSRSMAKAASPEPLELAEVDATLQAPPPSPAEMPHYIYIVNGAEVDARTYTTIDPSLIASRTFTGPDEAAASWGDGVDGIWHLELRSSIDDYVRTSENEIDITYAIDLPYAIPGNGKEQSLELKTQEVDASYRYYCAPRLDAETYLLAEIALPERLNLLNGKANVTYEGTYIGETDISITTAQPALTLTLGMDRRVAVRRTKVQDFSTTRFLGTDVEQTFTYRLTVRNGQNRPVRMTLKDQYPISTQKDIKVELLSRTTPPTFNVEDVGVLTWEEELQPGETKVYEISYSVKYPRNRHLNL